MKGMAKIIIFSSMFALSSFVMADESVSNATQQVNTGPGMWICTTNASSAPSGSSEEQADKTMGGNAAIGGSVFEFALKHCRDCTKITCELQTKPAQ